MFALQAEVRQAGERLTFLLDYAVLPEEDLELNSKTFQWPARIDPIFEVSQHKLVARREVAENEVKKRSVGVVWVGLSTSKILVCMHVINYTCLFFYTYVYSYVFCSFKGS